MNTSIHDWDIGFEWLMPLLIVIILLYLFQDKKKEKSSAQEILDKRYANGGINKEEYEEKSSTLKAQEN